MNTIKFTRTYKKLMGVNLDKVLLLNVIVIDLKRLSKPFLDYDTDNGKYKFPRKGKCLMLIFEKNTDKNEKNLFTTLRRYSEEKYNYYHLKIGKYFKIEINEADKK